jgi:hypothetical protein
MLLSALTTETVCHYYLRILFILIILSSFTIPQCITFHTRLVNAFQFTIVNMGMNVTMQICITIWITRPSTATVVSSVDQCLLVQHHETNQWAWCCKKTPWRIAACTPMLLSQTKRVNWIYATTTFIVWRNAIIKRQVGNMPLQLSYTSSDAIFSTYSLFYDF